MILHRTAYPSEGIQVSSTGILLVQVPAGNFLKSQNDHLWAGKNPSALKKICILPLKVKKPHNESSV